MSQSSGGAIAYYLFPILTDRDEKSIHCEEMTRVLQSSIPCYRCDKGKTWVLCIFLNWERNRAISKWYMVKIKRPILYWGWRIASCKIHMLLNSWCRFISFLLFFIWFYFILFLRSTFYPVNFERLHPSVWRRYLQPLCQGSMIVRSCNGVNVLQNSMSIVSFLGKKLNPWFQSSHWTLSMLGSEFLSSFRNSFWEALWEISPSSWVATWNGHLQFFGNSDSTVQAFLGKSHPS